MYVRLAVANAIGAATMILGALVSFGLDWEAPGLLVLAIGGAAAVIYATYGWIHGNRWRKRRNLLSCQRAGD